MLSEQIKALLQIQYRHLSAEQRDRYSRLGPAKFLDTILAITDGKLSERAQFIVDELRANREEAERVFAALMGMM